MKPAITVVTFQQENVNLQNVRQKANLNAMNQVPTHTQDIAITVSGKFMKHVRKDAILQQANAKNPVKNRQ